MAASFVLFVIGLGLLLGGGDSLVRGAASIGRSLGIPPLAIGLTVVAFGTSAPELVVATTGSIKGYGGVAFGNTVGASIVNLSMILGLTAMFRPLEVNPTVITRELPMLLLAMIAALIMANDEWLGIGPNRLDRDDGLILMLLFCVFLYYTVMSLRQAPRDQFIQEARLVGWRVRAKAITMQVGLVMLGLVGLGFGGNLLVSAAVEIAGQLGMTPAAIALTIVSIGTTMPELLTSLIAARKGQTDLAVGNVVGSNIFNILLVLGVASTLAPFDVPDRGPFSLLIASVLTMVLMVLIFTRASRITRTEGAILLLLFGAYMYWVVVF